MDGKVEDIESLVWQLVYCILGVFFLLISTGHLQLGLITAIRRRFSPFYRQIVDLRTEIHEHRTQLAKIPIMDEFAAHCRKKRVIEKLTSDLQKLTAKRDKVELSTNILWALFGKAACTSLAFYLAAQSTDLIVTRIDSSSFCPFNFLLSYPCNSIDQSKTPVSLFSFSILTFMAAKSFHQRVVIGPPPSTPAVPKLT